MKPIQITDLREEQINELANIYRMTHDVRLRTRAHMVLLAAEHSFPVAVIATLCAKAKGRCVAGSNAIRRKGSMVCEAWCLVSGGAPPKVTKEY